MILFLSQLPVNKKPIVPQLVHDDETRIAISICGILICIAITILFFRNYK